MRDTAIDVYIPEVHRQKRQRKRKEKKDIRARCVTCIALIVMCAVALGVIGLLLKSDTNTGLFGHNATTPIPDLTLATYNTRQEHTNHHNMSPLARNNDTDDDILDSAITAQDSDIRPATGTPRVTTDEVEEKVTNDIHNFRPSTQSHKLHCIPVNETKTVCTRLPYAYTTAEANKTAFQNVSDYFFDSTKTACAENWWLFLCAHVLPECQPNPATDWLPPCVCTAFNSSIYESDRGNLICDMELGDGGLERELVSCTGRADPTSDNCVKP